MPALVYCLAAAACTWPLILHPASLLGAPVGPGDPFLYLWTLGWGMRAVLTDPVSLVTGQVFDANIFHPAAGTLAYSDHLLMQSLVLAPLYAVTDDVVLCYNVLLLASLVASALAMHLFVSRVVGTTGGAYLAGLAWGFGSYRFAHLIHVQLQALYFLPLAFLALHQLIATRRRRDAVALGVLAGMQAIASVYYAVIGGVALVTCAVALVFVSSRGGRGQRVARLALAAVVAGVLVLPVGVVYWRVQQEEGFGRNLYQASQGAAFVDSYLQAPSGNVLYGRTGLLRRTEGASNTSPPHTGPERELFPGFVVIALGLAGVWLGWRSDARALVSAMVLVTVVGFVLSLGPDGVRTFYATLHRYVFGFQAIRAPARFSVLVIFGLATLAAIGWRELSQRGRQPCHRSIPRFVAPLLLGCAALEWAHVPVALAEAPPRRTEVGQWLRQAPGVGAVAVLPLGFDAENTPAMVQSLEHRRPLVNGYSGQRPAFYLPFVDTLSTFPSEESLLALHRSAVRYIVTPSVVPRPPDGTPWPLVPRAEFARGTIYELVWTSEIEERFGRLARVPPPPVGRIPFVIGEKAQYTVSWDGGGVNLPAGEIVIAVEPPQYRLVVTAATASWVSRFFEANDSFVTTTDAQLLPQVHERVQNEGSRHVVRTFVYDWPASLVKMGRSMEEARGATAVGLPLSAYARDAIAAAFYVRTLALDSGARYQIPINEAGRSLMLEVRVGGRERIAIQGERIEAIRLDPLVRQQVERRRPVVATMWLSADDRRVPVAAEFSAGFGHVRVELHSYHGGP